jgi:hypothetical protein
MNTCSAAFPAVVRTSRSAASHCTVPHVHARVHVEVGAISIARCWPRRACITVTVVPCPCTWVALSHTATAWGLRAWCTPSRGGSMHHAWCTGLLHRAQTRSAGLLPPASGHVCSSCWLKILFNGDLWKPKEFAHIVDLIRVEHAKIGEGECGFARSIVAPCCGECAAQIVEGFCSGLQDTAWSFVKDRDARLVEPSNR